MELTVTVRPVQPFLSAAEIVELDPDRSCDVLNSWLLFQSTRIMRETWIGWNTVSSSHGKLVPGKSWKWHREGRDVLHADS